MKRIDPSIFFAVLLLFVVLLPACDTSSSLPPQVETNMWETLQSNPDYSTLVVAIRRAGFTNEFLNNGPFTLFAPNDAAFEVFLANQLISDINTIPVPQLQSMLRFHLISGRLLTKNMQTAAYPTFLPEQTLSIQVNDDRVLIQREVTIVRGDMDLLNGTIHEIDKVLEPNN